MEQSEKTGDLSFSKHLIDEIRMTETGLGPGFGMVINHHTKRTPVFLPCSGFPC